MKTTATFVFLSLALGVTPAAAIVTFNDPNATVGDRFGWNVHLDGNNVLIGAPNHGLGVIGNGYLFDLSGNLLQTFNDPSPTAESKFGVPSALDGNNVLIGSPAGDNVGGQAHLFDLNGNLLQTFDDPNATTAHNFGWSLALDGNNVLMGAPARGTEDGHAYLFDLSGNLLQTFDDPTPTTEDWFGFSVALDGNNVLIGARYDDTNGTDVGQAHLFDGNPLSPTFGNLLQTFDDPTPTTEDSFGWSVALDGNNVLIGAQRDDTNGTNVGQAYLFDLSGNLLRTFDDPTPTTEDNFGHSVALDGNNVLIGADLDDTNGNNVGEAYLFDLSGNLLRTFDDSTVTTEDRFGHSVTLDGNNVLIGAPNDDTLGEKVGQAHLFSFLPGDFNFNGIVDGEDFLLWQSNPSVGLLSDWEANYGAPLSAISATVPEPTTCTLALAALCLAISRRRAF